MFVGVFYVSVRMFVCMDMGVHVGMKMFVFVFSFHDLTSLRRIGVPFVSLLLNIRSYCERKSRFFRLRGMRVSFLSFSPSNALLT